MVIALVGVVAVAATSQPIAAAQDQTPEELWNAYPLKPGDEKGEPRDPAPTPTPSEESIPSATATATVTAAPPAAENDGGGIVLPVAIGFVAAAFAVGLVAGRRRLRRPAAAPEGPVAGEAPAVSEEPVAWQVPVVRPEPAARPEPMVRPEPAARERRRERPRTEPEPAARGRPRAAPRELPLAAPTPRIEPARPAPAPRKEPARPRRFAPRPWPAEAAKTWTCVIDWKAGYLRSRFRAMVAPPGETERSEFARTPPKWTFMDDPEPATDELVALVEQLKKELVEEGWVPVGRSGAWYAQRFLWGDRHREPRPLAPLAGKEADD